MPTLEDLARLRHERIDELHRCQRGRTALLVIDMQHGFLDEGAALEVADGRAIVPNIATLIDTCRNAGVPVIFTEFIYTTAVPCLRGDPFGIGHLPARPGGTTGFGTPSSNCLVGQAAPPANHPDSAATIDALAPRNDELVIQAHTYDKFYGTPLDLALRSRDIRCLLFTGVTTDICVNSTLISAAMRDYRCTAVTDGCATINDELQQACLSIWDRKYARLRTTEQVVEEISALK